MNYLVAFIGILFSWSCFSNPIQYFDKELNQDVLEYTLEESPQKLIKQYDATIESLYGIHQGNIIKKGLPVVLKFSNGKRFLIHSSLGTGHTTFVFKVTNLQNNKLVALRVPKKEHRKEFFNYWNEYHEAFKKKNFPSPELYSKKTNIYTEVEYFNIKFTLADIINRPYDVPKSELNNFLKAYKKYLKKTQNNPLFGDDRPINIGFDGEKVFAIDWSTRPMRYDFDFFSTDPDALMSFYLNKKSFSYTKYLNLDSGDPLIESVNQKLKQMIESTEKVYLKELLSKYLRVLPISLADKSFKEAKRHAFNAIKNVTNKQKLERILVELIFLTEKWDQVESIISNYKGELNEKTTDLILFLRGEHNPHEKPDDLIQFILKHLDKFNKNSLHDKLRVLAPNLSIDSVCKILENFPKDYELTILKTTFPYHFKVGKIETNALLSNRLARLNLNENSIEYLRSFMPYFNPQHPSTSSRVKCLLKKLTH